MLNLRRLYPRIVSIVLVLTMCVVDVSAIIKTVPVWGVRSINDRGASDTVVTMEDLEADYSGYMQTDGLTEYFHKDQGELPKRDMTEALSWLIDNQIICRDSVITVSNIQAVPNVSISKEDVLSKLYLTVNRSDALMYIYKSVFGPLNGRTIGVESQNIRTDAGREDLLHQIMAGHGYFDLMVGEGEDNIKQEAGQGGSASEGTEFTGRVHIDIGGNGTGSKDEEQEITSESNPNAWRYTPQGDKVISVFGDTNFFISDVEINQEVKNDATSGDHGSGGVVIGSSQQAIDYDTDYKNIFYLPAADLWFYRTTDVVEMYLQSLQSKGLVEFDNSLRTELFDTTFSELADKGNLLASWSGQADPYVINLSTGKHVRVENVQYAPNNKVLGKSFTVDYNGSALVVRRTPLFESDTGYFTTERCNRMDIYKYIYVMVSANEKKLTELESDIVSYKYGLQYGDGLPEGDIEVIKFLVAKGILNYDGSDELSSLYTPMSWDSLIPILYRVANKDARLDFSKIQLTDSEQVWKAQGFQPSSLDILPSGSVSQISVEYTDAYNDMYAPDLDVDLSEREEAESESEPDDGANEVPTSRAVIGSRTDMEPRVATTREEVSPFITYARSEESDAVNLSIDCMPGTSSLHGIVFYDFNGYKHVTSGDKGLAEFTKLLGELDKSKEQLYSFLRDEYNSTNAKHKLLVEFLQNIHFIAAVTEDRSIVTSFTAALDEWVENPSQAILTDKNLSVYAGENVTWEQARKRFCEYAKGLLTEAQTTKKVPINIQYGWRMKAVAFEEDTLEEWHSISDNIPISTLVSIVTGHEGRQLVLKFDYLNTSGTLDSYEMTFATDSSSPNVTSEKEVNYLNSAKAQLTTGKSLSDFASKGEAELVAEFGSSVDVMSRQEGIYFSDSESDASRTNYSDYFSDAKLSLYADPTSLDQGYVEWNEVYAASKGNIVQVSELILENKLTRTRAYFSLDSDASKTRVIVGAVVINGNSQYGVVKKVVDDNGAEKIYYHIGAIRQLMSLSDERECVGGRSCIAVASDGVIKNTNYYPVLNNSGTQSSQVAAIRALVHTNAKVGDVANANNAMYKAGITLNNQRYCNFISLSQSNRVANIIYRKFTYTPDSNTGKSGRGVAYGVVVFKPVDIGEVGSPSVSSSTSLQDLLDAPGQPPAGDQTQWNRNMRLCNDYANWIYGTQDANYINTGYLEPEVYLFFLGRQADNKPPANLYGVLTDTERKDITVREMGVVSDGVTAARHATTGVNGFTPAGVTESCSYYVDTSYRAMLAGDRLFLNEAMFDNIVFHSDGKKSYYELQGGSATVAQFSQGSVFKFFQSSNAEYGNPTGRVTAVSSTGEVTVQVGPFVGLPIRYAGRNSVVSGSLATSEVTLGEATWESTTRNGETVDGVDLWLQFYHDIAQKGLTRDWISGATGKVCAPALFSSSGNSGDRIVYDGSNLKVYKDISQIAFSTAISASSGTETFAGVFSKLKGKVVSAPNVSNSQALGNNVSSTEVYYEIKFPAWHYKISNGVLTYTVNSGMSSFLNPALFTSVNDLIIDKMIDKSSGAIPVNEIPVGSLLQIGDNYYQAVGTDTETKVFVGYAPIFEAVAEPKPVHAAKSFVTQMIYAGNQYINVSHFIEKFTMLQNNEESGVLSDVARKTLSRDNRVRSSIDCNGATKLLSTNVSSSSEIGSVYTPIKIRFMDGLMAYQGTPVEDIDTGIVDLGEGIGEPSAMNTKEDDSIKGAGTATYVLCNHADSAPLGAFSQIPFLTNDVLNVSLYAITVEPISAGFEINQNAPGLRLDLQKAFQQVFAKDLFTLVRYTVFIVVMWLIIASWMCYFMRIGNMLPILEAIRYPSGDRGKKGVDLMKVVSCGTISLDTEFGLGRFIQYNLILSVLMCVIMLLG